MLHPPQSKFHVHPTPRKEGNLVKTSQEKPVVHNTYWVPVLHNTYWVSQNDHLYSCFSWSIQTHQGSQNLLLFPFHQVF